MIGSIWNPFTNHKIVDAPQNRRRVGQFVQFAPGATAPVCGSTDCSMSPRAGSTSGMPPCRPSHRAASRSRSQTRFQRLHIQNGPDEKMRQYKEEGVSPIARRNFSRFTPVHLRSGVTSKPTINIFSRKFTICAFKHIDRLNPIGAELVRPQTEQPDGTMRSLLYI